MWYMLEANHPLLQYNCKASFQAWQLPNRSFVLAHYMTSWQELARAWYEAVQCAFYGMRRLHERVPIPPYS